MNYKFYLFPIFLAILNATARMWDFCACQLSTGGLLDLDATQKVALTSCTPYIWGPADNWRSTSATSLTQWLISDGPKFQGAYVQNYIKRNRIDGKTFNRECIAKGAKGSTCFNCDSPIWIRTVENQVECRDVDL